MQNFLSLQFTTIASRWFYNDFSISGIQSSSLSILLNYLLTLILWALYRNAIQTLVCIWGW